ncbi:hypothetical protein [Ensifer canadensis]
MAFEFDVDLSVAAVKLRLYRDFFDHKTRTWSETPLKSPQTNPRMAHILYEAQPEEEKHVFIDPKWVGDLFTNPYGLVRGRRAPDRVVRAALKVCPIDEVKHQPSTTLFLSSMEKVATKRYEGKPQRLQAFRDHYDPVFRELLRLSNIPLPVGYDPDEDDNIESIDNGVGIANGKTMASDTSADRLSLDGAAMLAHYYGWLCYLEAEVLIATEN